LGFQLAQAIQKLSYNSQFFPNGGGDHRRIPSNPEVITSLHVASVETENIRQNSAREITQQFQYLGWIWDSVNMTVQLPKDKPLKILKELRNVKKNL
jgi:hypothetical protein